jgi:predicted HTH domain antitoxin
MLILRFDVKQAAIRCPARIGEITRCACRDALHAASAAMQLTLPKTVEDRVTPRTASLGMAIGMFVTEEVTLGQAAEIAGISQAEMLEELGQRRIAIHYSLEELAEDWQIVGVGK